ncbi:hypothetical protein C7401_106182 [Paraburkholderia unamae]|uniref:DUF7673 family protein n=1 Tax=Paraburkholderia unamae TaxID=219649 RepID=UPI000DC28EB4|nr:hypothetical protein [Paraburkholderia unamae]RAR62505.1 hypothetical protein C7401_106182 [Paraburkholderia unamae]
MRPEVVLDTEKQALQRLLDIARGNTGQALRVADFLLAWWNPAACGRYDLTTAWSLDDDIVEDVITVFRLASRVKRYPDALGYGAQFEAVVAAWRPELVHEERGAPR